MVPPTEPLLTPAIRQRLKEKFPQLEDSDLPLFVIPERELIDRIAKRTHQTPAHVRAVLTEVGVFVARRRPKRELHMSHKSEESLGSGVPDDTGQSGAMGLGPGW